ncbi:MAG: hypothetical protein ACLQLC_02055, partial [Candidatus Sulfotelmatobacter sp.]
RRDQISPKISPILYSMVFGPSGSCTSDQTELCGAALSSSIEESKVISFVYDAIANTRLKTHEFGREPVKIKRNAERSTHRIKKMACDSPCAFLQFSLFGDMDH